MSIWEVLLIGAALAMDAVAVSMANGMTEPRMRPVKALAIALTFAVFQFVMPVIGYYCGYAFASVVERIAPWLSFVLLAFIGGKMIVDCILEMRERKKVGQAELPREERPLGAGKLLVQGVATSLDALAVGVTLLATETQAGLPFHAAACAAVIGAVTFVLSFAAVYVGKKVGDKFADWAGVAGGAVLIGIGLKILLEGIL